MSDIHYKSLKSWKIDNIDVRQQFSLSIFSDFRCQSIKITWLLPIFIDWLLDLSSKNLHCTGFAVPRIDQAIW